jgi:serine protease Do
VSRIVSTGEQGGRIVRPWLGINMQRVTPDIAAGFNLPRPAGLVVKEVFPGGPGAHAGLKRNDVIIALKDQPIDDEASLRFRLATLQVDTVVPVKVIRAGKELVFDMKLAAPPEDPPRDPAVLEGRQPLSGAGVANLSPAVADELGLVEWRPGVIVTEVKAGSFAGRFVRPGDMILSVNGQDVKNVAELKTRIAAGVASVSIGREGMVSTVQFR